MKSPGIVHLFYSQLTMGWHKVFASRFLVAAIFCGCLSFAASAQTFRGAINGTVTDPSGAAVANARVVAMEISTGIEHTTLTNTEGVYAFQDIQPALYKVTVTATGFPPYVVDKIEVSTGSIYTLQVKLSLEKQSTVVEVSAAELSMDTTSQVETMSLPPDVVQNIPLNGRDFTQLVALSPGYAGYSVGGFGSLNGTRPNQMDWQIDGIDNNDFWHNIPAVNQGGVSGIAGIIMPVDAIDEFSVQTQSGAEAGRNAGGTNNQVIKSGGNSIHGSAYYYNRNEDFAAASPFFVPTDLTPKAPRLRNENIGGTVGGPILKNKFFYYAAFEYQNYIIGLSGLATEPSTPWVNQALSILQANEVPVNPISKALLGQLYPGQTTQGLWPSSIANLAPTPNNFFSSSPSTGYSYNGLAKVDYNINEKNNLSVRGFMGQGSQTAPLGTSTALATASSNLAYYFEKAPIHVQNWAVVLNSTLQPTLSNQVLFGINSFYQTFRDANASFNTESVGLLLSPDALINGEPILGSPNIQIGNPTVNAKFEQVGITAPEGRHDITGVLTDILSWTKGKHQIRFGGEVRQGRVDEFYYRNSLGSFAFNGSQGPWKNVPSTIPAANLPYALALADFIAGDIATANISVGDAERNVTVNAYSLFIGDSWQATSNLNLTFGLRYEYFGPLHDGKGDLPVFIPGQGLVVQGVGITNLFDQDKNNFAPRFGFAYKPPIARDLVVRGGVGIFYDQINMNPFLDYRPPNLAADGLQDNPAGASPVSNYTLSSLTWQPNTYLFPGVTTCPTGNGCAATGYGIYSVNQNFRTPYFYNFNLQIEKGIGNFGQFQIGYVGSVGHKLSVMLNINQAPLTATCVATPALPACARPFAAEYPDFGDINQLNSIGNSNYNSLQSTFKIRQWHGLTSQLTYTWGHTLDDVTEYRGVIPLDSNVSLKEEYGNSDFDTRNSFAGQAIYSIPHANWASGWKGIFVNGWQVSALVVLHGGQPFNITGATSRPGYYIFGNPFVGVDHVFSAANGGLPWVNPCVFFTPGQTTPSAGCPAITTPIPTDPHGNLSRNRYYGPNFKDLDLSVIKNIPITERVQIQLRAEMYNTFNYKNLASGAGAVGGNGYVSDTIGDFNGAPGIGPGEPFNLQLVAKILF